MKRRKLLVAVILLVAAPLVASAHPSTTTQISQSRIEPNRDEHLARDWGLNNEEWSRYRELMKGPLGIYSPDLDPLTALGIEARSDEERRRYAELQVRAEARRVEKLLAYQQAYDEAWQRLHPNTQRVNLPGGTPEGIAVTGGGRRAVFVRDNCHPCEQVVRQLQASGTEFDLYMVGSRADDARIRQWAHRARIDPAKVRNGTITLNHDAGRWLSLGLSGGLPAVVHQEKGQWRRQ